MAGNQKPLTQPDSSKSKAHYNVVLNAFNNNLTMKVMLRIKSSLLWILLVTWALSATAAESPFITLDPQGSVSVTLHPNAEIVGQGEVEFTFSVPWPKGLLKSDKFVRVSEDDAEMAASVVETLRWRTLAGESPSESIAAARRALQSAAASLQARVSASNENAESVRATRITIERAFDTSDPVQITVHWGQAPTLALPAVPGQRDNWVSANEGPDPNEYPRSEQIREPPVFATLPPEWLGSVLIRGRTVPVSSVGDFGFFDEAMVGYARTAVNDVASSVADDELIDYLSQPSPWLFDRASTLYSVYLRTGDVKWLRHAHRATEYYANHIVDGGFDLRPGDLKYNYGRPFLIQALLLGDTQNLAKATELAITNRSWPTAYATSLGFWTERHTAYAILSELNLWQIDGNTESASRINHFIESLLSHLLVPPNGWDVDGCLLHTVAQHEGNSIQEPTCSPWMSALLGEAIWEHYLASEDTRSLELLSSLTDYIVNFATRTESIFENALRPWFLASSTYTQGDDFDDMEHTCDVAGLAARGVWAKVHLGLPANEARAVVQDLFAACQINLDYWFRPASTTRPTWQLSPPRKFNWWFGTTTDLPWLLSAAGIRSD